MNDLPNFLQWTALITSASTCFIAAGISFWVFFEQRKSSKEFQILSASIDEAHRKQAASSSRDEFIRWLLSQSVHLQEDLYVLTQMVEVATRGAQPRVGDDGHIQPLRTEIERKVYELRVFSGDDRAIKQAAGQLISVFPDHRSLEVIELAARTLGNDIGVWLSGRAKKMRSKLYPPQYINSKAWTG